jgi:predicted aspartyl protease
VPLARRLRNELDVKIEIGGTSTNFLFDGGASDLIINQDLEHVLLQDGSLRPEDYLIKLKFMLTNKQAIEIQFIRLRSVRIGEYTVRNVIAGIIKDATLLCGTGFLDKFKKWELPAEGNVLVLYK